MYCAVKLLDVKALIFNQLVQNMLCSSRGLPGGSTDRFMKINLRCGFSIEIPGARQVQAQGKLRVNGRRC